MRLIDADALENKICANSAFFYNSYCPNCGAQMDENNTQKMSVDGGGLYGE